LDSAVPNKGHLLLGASALHSECRDRAEAATRDAALFSQEDDE
jgi:hypothetical protein